MKFLSGLALYALRANAAALSPRDAPTTFPNRQYADDGNYCPSINDKSFDEVPYECVYNYVCNQIVMDSFQRCFEQDQEPKGVISLTDLKSLSFECQQQAICGFSEPEDFYNEEWYDDNEYDNEEPYLEPLQPLDEPTTPEWTFH